MKSGKSLFSIFFVTICFLNCNSNLLYSQKQADLHSDNIKEPGWEFVISGIVNTDLENEYEPATELHITYWISHKSAIGFGYTLIFTNENHVDQELAALFSYKPVPVLTVNIGPSFALDNSKKERLSGYLEGELNLKIGRLHTDPVIGGLFGKKTLVFGGIHLGYEL